MFKLKTLSQAVAATVATSFLVGCGGGSSSGSSTSTSTTTDVTGSVFASNVAGAQVAVQDANGNPVAGPVTTNASGHFLVPVPNANLGGDLVFVATGGSYADEATGDTGVNSERLAVFAAANTLTGSPTINATPGSSLIERLIVEYGLSKEAAEAAFESAFGYLPDTGVTPVDATQQNDDASDEAKLAGVRAAAFSQLLENLGLEAGDHKALLDALAEDLADGSVDGTNGTNPVQLKGEGVRPDMASQFAVALMTFANDADRNKSGLSLGQLGSVQFISKAESENYSFELTPKGMIKEGKAIFDLTINESDSPVQGVMPMMMPMMYMASGHMHSTPNSGCSMTDASGVAECTAYFLMPSVMGNGDVMGNWDLMFSVGMGDNAESVHFFPKVSMAMGDTVKATLKGDSGDQIAMMDGMAASRSYNIFNNGLSGMGNMRSIELFISAQESMMSFPALVDGEALNAGTDYAMTPGSIVVRVSTDNATWVTATTDNEGVWTASNLMGLVDGEEGTLYVQLSVDGVQKTTDGQAADIDNIAAQFTVTPGADSMNMEM